MFHLSTQGNTKLLEQLKSEFKRTINLIKYQSKVSTQTQNQYLSFLIDPRFQVNRFFVLSFEDNAVRSGHTRYFLSNVKIKGYNVMTVGRNFFDQPVKDKKRTYHNI